MLACETYMQALLPLLPWVHVILSILLIIAILLQRNEAGLGAAFGGDTSGPSFQKRGIEKTLFIATIVIALLFVLSVLLPQIVGLVL